MSKTQLQPAAVFNFFEEICQIPRPSKKRRKNQSILGGLRQKKRLVL